MFACINQTIVTYTYVPYRIAYAHGRVVQHTRGCAHIIYEKHTIDGFELREALCAKRYGCTYNNMLTAGLTLVQTKAQCDVYVRESDGFAIIIGHTMCVCSRRGIYVGKEFW